jgi:hypothetical protein
VSEDKGLDFREEGKSKVKRGDRTTVDLIIKGMTKIPVAERSALRSESI